MPRLSPNAFILYIAISSMVFFLIFIMDKTGLIETMPGWIYTAYGISLTLFFIWWPVNMLLYWEKRTPASLAKDRYIMMVVVTFTLFLLPYHFFQTPLWPTMGAAALVGIILPSLLRIILSKRSRRIEIDPRRVQKIALQSPTAQEFLRYFPQARHYVYGHYEPDSEKANLLLHHRASFEAIPRAKIDYTLKIPVDRNAEIHISEWEDMNCYFFIKHQQTTIVGFLPSSNIGRVLDFGFSDDEIERAIEEAKSSEQQWNSLDDKPIALAYFPGRVVQVK